jgi:hypothetical protein
MPQEMSDRLDVFTQAAVPCWGGTGTAPLPDHFNGDCDTNPPHQKCATSPPPVYKPGWCTAPGGSWLARILVQYCTDVTLVSRVFLSVLHQALAHQHRLDLLPVAQNPTPSSAFSKGACAQARAGYFQWVYEHPAVPDGLPGAQCMLVLRLQD